MSDGAQTGTFAVVGLFKEPQVIIDAANQIRPKKLGRLEAYSPYPVHGLDHAIGLGESRLGMLVMGMGVLGFSGDGTMTRLADRTGGEDDMGRVNAYRLTMEAIDDSPLVGNGLGTFLPAFRVYRDAGLSGSAVWDYAHNVYLETAMDLGLPGTIVFHLGFVSILVVCLRGLALRRRDHIHPATAISALVLLGAHGLVDFSPQTPAVAMTLALLLGVGYAQSWPTQDRSDPADSSENA